MYRYKFLIRRANTSSYQTFNTYIMADNDYNARATAEGMFGAENVINYTRVQDNE